MDFVRENIDAMNKEFAFWTTYRMKNITKNGKVFRLAVYDVEVDGPRPGNFTLIVVIPLGRFKIGNIKAI